MLARYSRSEMANIWSDQNKYQIWLAIEAYSAEAMEKLGLIPAGTAAIVWEKGKFSVERILEIEKTTKHDVIAFLTNLAESIGDASRFLHLGMTSSDVLDTCLSKQLAEASDILLTNLDKLLKVLKDKAFAYKEVVCVGRSHGIHAEPITFGLKMARFYAEFKRNKERLIEARGQIAVCAISGAVGTYATIDPFVQQYVAEKMQLTEETVSTQVIPRDRHAFFFATLALIASSIENIAVEIRHLQRSEVLEAEEFFSVGQKGSSAMPHKRNPILSENLTGLARLVRSAVIPMMENVALWHERDISHSAVERVLAPDVTIALDFALNRLIEMIENLLVYPENMAKNLSKLNGLVFSQRVLLHLIEEVGFSREEAYQIVQRNAMKVWEEGLDFKELLINDEQLKKVINLEKLKAVFDYSYYTKNIDTIFSKVFA